MDKNLLIASLIFKAIKSSGPGGQHVNKTASKVEAHLDLYKTNALTETEKNRLLIKLKNRISADGILILSCSESRSQHRNKAIVITRLLHLISESLKVQKKRRKTKPSKSVVEKRLRSKKNNALKKANRRRPPLD